MNHEETLRELAQVCTEAVYNGVPPEEICSQLVAQGVAPDVAQFVVQTVVGELGEAPAHDDVAAFWAQLCSAGQQLLNAGRTTVELYHQMTAMCTEFFPDAEDALLAARNATESISSVHAANIRAPLDEHGFFVAVHADLQQIPEGAPEGPTAPLYPSTLPRQFFFHPDQFLDMCERMGARCLDVLWKTTPGCEGLLSAGVAHNGRLKDDRRYLVLRLPPPQVRFEAHYVAFVGAGAGSPARMLAMERGGSPEEAVLCECYADGGRLRLGAAGPAESNNFIRLIRQQLGL